VIDDCHGQGLPLVLEPLVYRLGGESEIAYTRDRCSNAWPRFDHDHARRI
jgi:tagatose-1,6-bisphosphate aldolase